MSACWNPKAYSSTIGRLRKPCRAAMLASAGKRPCLSRSVESNSSNRDSVNTVALNRSAVASSRPLDSTKRGRSERPSSSRGTMKFGTSRAVEVDGGNIQVRLLIDVWLVLAGRYGKRITIESLPGNDTNKSSSSKEISQRLKNSADTPALRLSSRSAYRRAAFEACVNVGSSKNERTRAKRKTPIT